MEAGNDTVYSYFYDYRNPKYLDGGAGSDLIDLNFYNAYYAPNKLVIDFPSQYDDVYEHIGAIRIKNFETLRLLNYVGFNDSFVLLGSGDDTISLSEGNDVIYGNGGDDYIDGGGKGDTINGGLGNDILITGGSTDVSEDRLIGGAGDDVLFGSYAHADYGSHSILRGGIGEDVFAFSDVLAVSPYDFIVDFNVYEDHIALYLHEYWNIDPYARQFDEIPYENLEETSTKLRFDIIGENATVIYNKINGRLFVEHEGDSDFVCVIRGAQDLDVSHFYYIGEIV
jgi:Ca2+-binding RTX toxin-like protein